MRQSSMCATVLLMVICATAGQAQEISIRRVSTLGGSDPEPLNARLAVLSGSSVFVVPKEMGGDIMVFDASTGEMTASERLEGSGPGEVRFANALAATEDGSVMVADLGNRKLLELDADLASHGSVRLPDGLSVEQQGLRVLPDGSFFINGTRRTEDGEAFLLHRFAPAGPIASWDSLDRSTRLVAPTFRPLATTDGGELWSALGSHMVFTRWGLDGERQSQLELAPSWFPEPSVRPERPVQEARSHTVAPPTFLVGIQIDSSGNIWSVVRVTDPDWTPSEEPSTPDEMYNSIISVVDPVSGEIIASRRLPVFVKHLLGEGLALVQRSDSNGIPFADVVAIGLEW